MLCNHYVYLEVGRWGNGDVTFLFGFTIHYPISEFSRWASSSRSGLLRRKCGQVVNVIPVLNIRWFNLLTCPDFSRAEGCGFPLVTINKKQKENRKTVQFPPPPTNCISLATWYLSNSPGSASQPCTCKKLDGLPPFSLEFWLCCNGFGCYFCDFLRRCLSPLTGTTL